MNRPIVKNWMTGAQQFPINLPSAGEYRFRYSIADLGPFKDDPAILPFVRFYAYTD